MEILICIIIILGLLLFAGVGLGDVLLIVVGLVGVLVVLVGLFFTVCLVFIAMSKRKSAVFVEMNEDGRYPVAVYDIDGERVRNVFPCEMVMKKRLYVPEKAIHVLHCRKLKRAIDGNALSTMIVGALIFIPASVYVVIKFVEFFSGGLVI